MARARSRFDIVAAGFVALVGCGAVGGTFAQAQGAVDLEVVKVLAKMGKGAPEIDPRIPATVRSKLSQLHYAYNKYTFLGAPRQRTPLGRAATFSLPDSEALAITPSAYGSSTKVLRLDTRILDSRKRTILNTQVRVGYGRVFLLHRPKRSSGLLLGISAHRAER